MARTVSHATTVSVPDDGTSPIGSDEWNAPDVVTGSIGLTDIPSGAANTVLWSAGAAPAAWTDAPIIGASVAIGSVAGTHILDITKAGTTALAPIRLESGVKFTTPAAGAIEYDGTAFYQYPIASSRGVAASEHFLSLAANQAGANSNTAQTWFPGGGATTITLPATTAIFFRWAFIAVALRRHNLAHNRRTVRRLGDCPHHQLHNFHY